MTVIVGLLGDAGSVMSADTQFEDSDMRTYGSKICRRGSYLVGACGNSIIGINAVRLGSIVPPTVETERGLWKYSLRLFNWAKDLGHGKSDDDDGVYQSPLSVLVVGRERIYECGDDGSITPAVTLAGGGKCGPVQFWAVGSGAAVATGAMDAILRRLRHPPQLEDLITVAEAAVDTAIRLGAGCGGPIETLSLRRKTR